MKKISLMLFCFLFLQGFVYAQESNDIIATVNGRNITKTYVAKVLQQDLATLPEIQRNEENIKLLANKIVNQKIDEILLIDAAKKADVEVSKEEIANAITNIKSEFGSEKDFQNDLKKQALNHLKIEFAIEQKKACLSLWHPQFCGQLC